MLQSTYFGYERLWGALWFKYMLSIYVSAAAGAYMKSVSLDQGQAITCDKF